MNVAAGIFRIDGKRGANARRGRTRSRRPTALFVVAMALSLVVGACGSATPSPTGATPSLGPSSGVSSAVPTSLGSSGSLLPPATPGAASAVPVPAPAPVVWTNCTPPFQCTSVKVPIDYDHPDSGMIQLALIRLPAADQARRIGDLLTNPGGPGASGVDFVRNAAESIFSAGLRARFDIVGFDPRGVGLSSPIQCVDGPTMDRLVALDPIPDQAGERTALIQGAQTFDAGCEANSGTLLPFMSTVSAARDMEQIRLALGETKLTYLGFSYGTFLGSTYANLFPGNVRAFVLDGAVDATQPLMDGLAAQAKAFEADFQAFLADCASHPSCAFYNGGKPGPAYDRLMASIDASPLPAARLNDPRPVGPGEALAGVIAAMYDQTTWPVLDQALAQAQAGDGSLLLRLSDSYNERTPGGTYANIAAANNAVNCADYTAPTDVATYDALAASIAKSAPHFGVAEVYSSLQCAFWPLHPSHDPVAPTAQGAPPILVLGTTGDPATPYADAVTLAHDLSSGVLLTRKGEGHTAYGGKSACIDAAVDAYLLSLAVPAAGTVCT